MKPLTDEDVQVLSSIRQVLTLFVCLSCWYSLPARQSVSLRLVFDNTVLRAIHSIIAGPCLPFFLECAGRGQENAYDALLSKMVPLPNSSIPIALQG